MPRPILKTPWCCGRRMTGNEKSGYRCKPHPRITVIVTTSLLGTGWWWQVRIGGEAHESRHSSGSRAAANAATRCLNGFRHQLGIQLDRRP
jgi:hypothetical protein